MARKSWIDGDMQATMIDDYARKLESFVGAIADGRIDDAELAAQEKRVVALMKSVEGKLDDNVHGEVTQLLCELSAYNTMQTLHEMAQARPVSKFRG
jgi:hypothetical protein